MKSAYYEAAHCAVSFIPYYVLLSYIQVFSSVPPDFVLPLVWQIKFFTHTLQQVKL